MLAKSAEGSQFESADFVPSTAATTQLNRKMPASIQATNSSNCQDPVERTEQRRRPTDGSATINPTADHAVISTLFSLQTAKTHINSSTKQSTLSKSTPEHDTCQQGESNQSTEPSSSSSMLPNILGNNPTDSDPSRLMTEADISETRTTTFSANESESQNCEIESPLSPKIPEFIRKLYLLLQERALSNIIRWSDDGKAFSIKDEDAFVISIMPKYFRNSNFLSFVRQLHKFGFRKVRRREEKILCPGALGKEHVLFNPNFQRNRADLLQNIVRKQKNLQETCDETDPNETGAPSTDRTEDSKEIKAETKISTTKKKLFAGISANSVEEENMKLNAELSALRLVQKQMAIALKTLAHNFELATAEILDLRGKIAEQDQLINTLVEEVAIRDNTIQNTLDLKTGINESLSKSGGSLALLVPKRRRSSKIVDLDSATANNYPSEEALEISGRTRNNGKRVAPSWVVAPKVLLVEDDPTCRKLSSKLLQKFGCKYDVATDGLAAVTRMNLDHYDIVLMDIMLPNLDGVSATHHIRQFNQSTPIISMTSNTTELDCETYFSTGMTDILAKPFSRDNFFDILERYCQHLLNQKHSASNPKIGAMLPHLPSAPSFSSSFCTGAAASSDPANLHMSSYINNLGICSDSIEIPASLMAPRTLSPESDFSRYLTTITASREWINAISDLGFPFTFGDDGQVDAEDVQLTGNQPLVLDLDQNLGYNSFNMAIQDTVISEITSKQDFSGLFDDKMGTDEEEDSVEGGSTKRLRQI